MGKRFTLREKEAKELLRLLKETYGFGVEPSKGRVGVLKSGDLTLYNLDGSPALMEREGKLLPTLFFQELIRGFPTVVVDMGAIPHICRGADVMAPGVRRVEGDFKEGSYVKIADEKYLRIIALGISLQASEALRGQKTGKVVKVFHYVGDKVWNLAKTVKPITPRT